MGGRAVSGGGWVLLGGLLVAVGGIVAVYGGYRVYQEQKIYENRVLGGDSYLALYPQRFLPANTWSLTWKHLGDYNMYDVEIAIFDPDFKPLVKLGTVTGNSRERPIYDLPPPTPEAPMRRIRAEINARNGVVVQVFTLRAVDGAWKMEIEEFYPGDERGIRLDPDHHVSRKGR